MMEGEAQSSLRGEKASKQAGELGIYFSKGVCQHSNFKLGLCGDVQKSRTTNLPTTGMHIPG